MSLISSGIERYQAHQYFSQTDTAKTAETQAGSTKGAEAQETHEDKVYLSEKIAVIEWLAKQTANLGEDLARQPANLSQLADNLLRYQLIGLKEAGKLMALARDSENNPLQPLPSLLQQRSDSSDSLTERQAYQHLTRLVQTLSAAQV